MQHLLVVGGGSAGHVIPALPVIESVRARGVKVSFIGTTSGLEQSLLAAVDVDFHAVAAGKLRRYWSWQNLSDLARIALGLWQAWRLLGRLRPDVVFSKGGFVSFPVAVAAWARRIPVLAHESDSTPGLANRLVMPFVRTLCLGFAETRVHSKRVKVVFSGTPVRADILQGDAVRGWQRLGLSRDKPLLLVTGGSLGATTLNRVVRAALPQLLADYHVLHVCGKGNLTDGSLAGYQQREYVSEGWGDLLAAADVVVSRAGANALCELLALRKCNLLVPLSAQASRGDQIQNAAFAARAGFSLVQAEDTLDADVLVAAVAQLQLQRAEFEQALATFDVGDARATIVAELDLLAASNS